jgi:hypothetical protein
MLKKLLVAGAAFGALAVATPASADLFTLDYTGPHNTSGHLVFYAPGLPGGHPISAANPSPISLVLASSWANVGAGNVTVTSQIGVGLVSTPALGTNDNLLISSAPVTPPHFTTGGLAFVIGTGVNAQVVDLYGIPATRTKPAADVEISAPLSAGNADLGWDLTTGFTPNTTTTFLLQDKGAPGPVPANGLPALAALAALGFAKLRSRFSR